MTAGSLPEFAPRVVYADLPWIKTLQVMVPALDAIFKRSAVVAVIGIPESQAS